MAFTLVTEAVVLLLGSGAPGDGGPDGAAVYLRPGRSHLLVRRVEEYRPVVEREDDNEVVKELQTGVNT